MPDEGQPLAPELAELTPGPPPPPGPGQRSLFRRILGKQWLIQPVIAVALLALAAWQIDLPALGHSFAHAQYGWLLFALAVNIGSRLVHAVEWQITLTKVGKAPFFGLFGALLIGTLVNAIIPASAGDVVKIQIVANRYRLPRAGLVASRGAEGLVNAVIMVIFIIVSFALPQVGFASQNLLWLLAAATAFALIASVFVSRRLPATMPGWSLLGRLPSRLRLSIERQWPRFHEGLEVIRRPRLLLVEVLLNIFGWGVDILIFWSYGQAFRLNLPLSVYLSVTVVIALITIFPLTFGNVGTYEVALLSAFALYSVPAHDALAYAVGTHLFSTAFNIGLGLTAMLLMGIRPGEVFRMRPRVEG